MRYIISIAVDGRLDIAVTADSPQQARAKALTEFPFADISKLEVVGYKAVNATDENDELTDF